jgi:hypothetical protein
VVQGLALKILHDQKLGALLRANVVEVTDMRVIEGGNRPCFALEASFQLRIGTQVRGKNFNCDITAQTRVAGSIHLSHAASTKWHSNFIGT